ncbi:hypothetical protein CGZ93_17765 [Enemella dayhoffiae]|uniref:Uncharacterized protein n=1 Tax=Enemella dayhoffiae TaxID=2016507 RepID=A0A255GL97_9ACTN|nr:hypothetical protein [Enemella dayhoffiae]OYO16608.1 hypothetical protein CGZ93_17765 [Enemella dayhoffiae]
MTTTHETRVDEPPFDPDYDTSTPPDPQDPKPPFDLAPPGLDEPRDPDDRVACCGDLTVRHLGTNILVRPKSREPFAGMLRSVRLDGGHLVLNTGRLHAVSLDTPCEVIDA